jgi:hypothetical protein
MLILACFDACLDNPNAPALTSTRRSAREQPTLSNPGWNTVVQFTRDFEANVWRDFYGSSSSSVPEKKVAFPVLVFFCMAAVMSPTEDPHLLNRSLGVLAKSAGQSQTQPEAAQVTELLLRLTENPALRFHSSSLVRTGTLLCIREILCSPLLRTVASHADIEDLAGYLEGIIKSDSFDPARQLAFDGLKRVVQATSLASTPLE